MGINCYNEIENHSRHTLQYDSRFENAFTCEDLLYDRSKYLNTLVCECWICSELLGIRMHRVKVRQIWNADGLGLSATRYKPR